MLLFVLYLPISFVIFVLLAFYVSVYTRTNCPLIWLLANLGHADVCDVPSVILGIVRNDRLFGGNRVNVGLTLSITLLEAQLRKPSRFVLRWRRPGDIRGL